MMQTFTRKQGLTMRITCKANTTNTTTTKFYKRVEEKVKDFGKKRSSVAKENFNKLVSVSQQDVQELGELFKELDTLHRSQFNELKEAFTKNTKDKVSCPNKTPTSSQEDDKNDTVTDVEVNVFVDK